jgi:ABC-type polysaccharide/polyol phosphate export permease
LSSRNTYGSNGAVPGNENIRKGMTLPSASSHVPLRPLVTTAARDLADGFGQWRLWGRLGWLEVRRRYSRTVIGPFWSAISLGMFVLALGSVGTGLWSKSASEYLPFLAAGMVVWLMIASIVTESCTLFVAGTNLFRQMRFNYSVMAYALVWRNLIVFAHNLLVFVGISLLLAPTLITPATLLVLPGLAVVLVNSVWVSIVLGMLCLRFRDVQQLITSLIQISMFVTPIFWPPENLQGAARIVFVDFNPLYHLIDIVRTPLLGRAPAAESYSAMAVLTVTGWWVTYLLFSHFRKRIAYWS